MVMGTMKVIMGAATLTFEREAGHRENHMFCHLVNCWLKNLKKLSFEVKLPDNLPFPHKNLEDSRIFVLHSKVLRHSPTRKRPGDRENHLFRHHVNC